MDSQPWRGQQWRAQPWLPRWLGHRGTAPDEAAAHSRARRPNWQLSPDRFYADLAAAEEYLSPGQKAAVRAVSAARGGDAVIRVLPTGSGKTDIVLTRAMSSRPRQTCLIVPTVALALDLERRVQELTGSRRPVRLPRRSDRRQEDGVGSAVPGGSAVADHLVTGSRRAPCSPSPLEASAAEGRLDLLAIDEAHIVAEWGDAFRPAFQTLAGLRRRILDLAPADRRPGHRDAHRHP